MQESEVILVHGLGSTFEHNWAQSGWTDILQAEGFRPVGVQLPGHGGAEVGIEAPDAILRAVEGPDAVRAIGFSAGAAALLAAATRQPERFERIALLGIGDGVLGETEPETHRLAEALRGDHEPEDVRARLFWRLIESAGNDRRLVADFLEQGRTPIAASELARVSCPVLVVLGDRDEAAPAEQLIAGLPEARGITLRGVDHFATTSDIGAIGAVVEFLGG